MEEYMRRFRDEKLKIANYPSLIAIEAFRYALLWNFDLFVEFTKTMPYTIEEAYGKAKNFVNLKIEIKFGRNSKSILKGTSEKEYRRISPNIMV